jgi:hypothetical protein
MWATFPRSASSGYHAEFKTSSSIFPSTTRNFTNDIRVALSEKGRAAAGKRHENGWCV